MWINQFADCINQMSFYVCTLSDYVLSSMLLFRRYVIRRSDEKDTVIMYPLSVVVKYQELRSIFHANR